MKAQMFKHSDWIPQTDVSLIQETFDRLLKAAGFRIISIQQHNFEPRGYTCVWLLAESHFAVHTFPEEGRTFIELSSCNWDKFMLFVQKLPHAVSI